MIGYGGHAGVYRAQHAQLRYPVAIKTLAGCRGSSLEDELRGRLLTEAEIGALVRHPNVLEIFDVGRTPDDDPYLVMELVDGETLRERLNRGVFTIAQVVDFALQALSGLSAIARHGIVHRDIKPSNLMLRPTERGIQVKLIDLGVARRVSHEDNPGSEEFLIGTPNYMAPEQLRAQAVDPRADLFSLGVVLYEALTGSVPPRPTFVERYALEPELSIEELPPLRKRCPECPFLLDAIIRKATALEREARYPNPAMMAEALAILARDLDVPSGARAWLEPFASPSFTISSIASSSERLATRPERAHARRV